MERLKDKIAIVTGAADGIGLAISKAFATEGATVILSDIDSTKCDQEALMLQQQGHRVMSVFCDVGKSEDVENLINTTINEFGKIDILVNNAAIAISSDIREMAEDDWNKLMNINLTGVFRGVKYALPHMVKQRAGSVITLSSTQAHRSWDNWTAYAACKGAILSMTKQLAGQFGSDLIRFNSISPGAINTALSKKRVENEGMEFLKASINQAAMLRLGQPEEVAMTAVFLASDEAKFITGEDIIIDGGLASLPRYCKCD